MFNYCLLLQRMDLGECPKYHDVALRADFEAASKKKDYFYDIDVSARKHHLHFYLTHWFLVMTKQS